MPFKTSLRRAALALVFVVPFGQPAFAAAKPMPAPHPAMFKIVHDGSTVYLFGSILIIKASLVWRTPEIDAAMASADSFAFETSLNANSRRNLEAYVDVKGYLPRGQFLHQLLSPQGLADYKTLLNQLPIDVNTVEHLRPWLAGITLSGRPATEEMSGVDDQVIHYGREHKKPLRYMESLEQQMGALTAGNQKTEISAFEEQMHHALTESLTLDDLTRVWITGDTETINRMGDKEFAKYPEAQAAILEKRNSNWVPEIEAMLHEKKTIFITVGAAHLSGPKSVVAMLCARGWKVERLTTGGITPPRACVSAPPALRQASLK